MHKCMWHYTSATSVGTLKTQGYIVGFIQNWFRFINLSDSYVKDKIGMSIRRIMFVNLEHIQYIPRNMHTVFALLCFVVVIHWLIFPYPSGLLHWHCGNLTIAPVPAKQPWWIWINTSCELIMNDCITTTKQSTTKPCAYFLGYTVAVQYKVFHSIMIGMILLKRIDIWVNIVADNALVLKQRPWPVTILICCIQFNQYH